MINMIKADIYRLVRTKGFYVALFLMLLMMSVSIYLVQPGAVSMTGEIPSNSQAYPMDQITAEDYSNMSVSQMREFMLGSEGYMLDVDIAAANMNLYYIFIFIAALVISADFSSGGVKNTLSSAISRRKYFISKALLVNICCVALLFLNNYLAHFLDIICNGKNLAADLATITKITLLQLPAILFVIALQTGLAFLLRKTSVFNTVVIPLVLIFQLLLSIAVMIFDINDKYLYYEIQSMLSNMTADPTKRYILNSCLLCFAAAAVCYAVGYISFKKAEIK